MICPTRTKNKNVFLKNYLISNENSTTKSLRADIEAMRCHVTELVFELIKFFLSVPDEKVFLLIGIKLKST